MLTKLYGTFVCSVLIVVAASSTLASDDEYMRSLQEDYLVPSGNRTENGSCVPNEALTGFVCDNVVLASTQLMGDELALYLDYNTEFDPSTELFHTVGVVYVTLGNVTQETFMNITFNSTTPNGTIVSQGRTPLGTVDLETNNAFFPVLPTVVELAHVAVLHRLEDGVASCEPGTICDNAVIHSTIGLFANGNKVNGRIEVTAKVDEPNAAHAIITTGSRVTNATMCSDLRYEMQYKQEIKADIDICLEGLNCVEDDRIFSPQGDDNVIMDNQCFEREYEYE